jgi:hypothetical protein
LSIIIKIFMEFGCNCRSAAAAATILAGAWRVVVVQPPSTIHPAVVLATWVCCRLAGPVLLPCSPPDAPPLLLLPCCSSPPMLLPIFLPAAPLLLLLPMTATRLMHPLASDSHMPHTATRLTHRLTPMCLTQPRPSHSRPPHTPTCLI